MKIFDAHQDIAGNIQMVSNKDFFERSALNECLIESQYACVNQVDYPRLIEGGVGLVFATIFAHSKEQALEQVAIYSEIIRKSKNIIPILSRTDLQTLDASRIGFLFNMEGATPLESDEDFDLFYNLGLRSLGISWRGANKYLNENSLSQEGRELVQRIEKRKMILDLAHMNEEIFWDTLQTYTKAPIVSHTACRSICDDERNLSDEQLAAVHERGGLIGIAGVNLLVGGTQLSNVVENIKHAAQITSITSICLGSDFDGMVNPKLTVIEGFEDVSCYPNLIEALRKEFSEKEVEMIAYKNLERFIEKQL